MEDELMASELRRVFATRFDHRYELISNREKFTEVVNTIPERYPDDALAIICQAALVVAEHPDFLMPKMGADMIVYSLASKDVLEACSPEERWGLIIWLTWLAKTELGKMCREDVDLAIRSLKASKE
jgi:hypothetical protein